MKNCDYYLYMKSLYDTIIANDTIDGHIHLFDHSGVIDSSLIDTSKRCVCFADISFRYIDNYKGDGMIAIYDEFINKCYDPSHHILLATGENAKDIIAIYERYPDKIKGFGELKCYSEYMHGKLPYGNLNWIRPVLDYNKDLGLPVYIHYNLNGKDRINKFENLLKKYSFPIVLCHCGMYDDCDYNLIHETIIDLMNSYDNLYVDISYAASDFYVKHINKLLELNSSKVIIGTDVNPAIGRVIDNPTEHTNELYDKFNRLNKLGNFNYNIKKLFIK